LYRDDEVVVVDKPSGLLVHPSEHSRERVTALSLVRDQVGAYVWPVHRLDRGTSGALAFALTKDAARTLHEAFEGRAHKEYLALVRGDFATLPDGALVDGALTYAIPKDEGAERVSATTRFALVESFGWISLVRAAPETGRFHQVRRHLKHLRYPLAGDSNYGTGWFNRKVREELGLARLALHAHVLEIAREGREAIRAESPLPADMQAALRIVRDACLQQV
jgi:tRNA pseudouridine65 synthase